ncbi:unnamed protein product [Rhizophagus irregularis]|uniref:Uncharacterized protein n=1 Tax=Rhizophagus irregularis TaxID=588596 RepID=A0A2I1FWR7_9GLOM|nr:hypothetical protein RhiirA4_414524 [Rhizophagus irregularis]CAB4405011.1 unnamed protein product [Rhizophagus irregularis]
MSSVRDESGQSPTTPSPDQKGFPPFLVVIYGLIRERHVDILGAMLVVCFIVYGIVLSITNDARIQLFRESASTGTIGLAFLITLIPIKIGSFQMRPMSYYFAKDMLTGGSFGLSPKKNNTDDIKERWGWERNWNNYAVFRRGYRILTALCGVGYIIETPAFVMIILKTPTIKRAFFWTNFVTYVWSVILVIIDVIYHRWFIKQIPEGEPTAVSQISVNHMT